MPLCTPAQPVRLGCAAPPKRRRLQAGSAPAAWHAGRRSHGGPAASGGAPLKGGHCSRGTPARGVSPPPASRSRVHVAPQSTVREGCWRLKASSRPSVSSGQRGLQLAVASRPVAQIRTQGVGGQSGCCPTRVCGGESCANLPAGDRWWGLVRAEASCRLGVGVWRSLWHHARGGATLEPLNHDGSPRAAIQPFNATYSEVGCHQIEAGKRVRLARTIGGGGGGLTTVWRRDIERGWPRHSRATIWPDYSHAPHCHRRVGAGRSNGQPRGGAGRSYGQLSDTIKPWAADSQ